MYILLRVDESMLSKVIGFLKRLNIWHKFFEEKMYDVVVTSQDRIDALHRRSGHGEVNPPAAWKTCASCRQIWDHDEYGRPLDAYVTHGKRGRAPAGKGYVTDSKGKRFRVAGDCDNPGMLNPISCSMWCPNYQPTTIDGSIFLAESVIEEHQRRIDLLKKHIRHLQESDKLYEEAVKTGGIIEYVGGQFVIIDPEKGGHQPPPS